MLDVIRHEELHLGVAGQQQERDDALGTECRAGEQDHQQAPPHIGEIGMGPGRVLACGHGRAGRFQPAAPEEGAAPSARPEAIELWPGAGLLGSIGLATQT